jgi:hypothetical protein
MALTPDQTAVLELLLAGQSYSELEELLGLDEAEVRSRARAALTELGGADPDRNVGLSDYLLGQADPIGRADAARHLRQDTADHELATTISERLAEIAPDADLQKLPPAPGGGGFLGRGTAPPVAAPAPRESRSPLAGIPKERGRLYAGLAAAAVILIAVVLGVTGVFKGDDEAPADSGETTTTANGEQDPAGGIGQIPDGEELSRVPLESPGKGDARGAAIVGLSTGDQAYLDLIIENLEPARQGDAYVVWFMFDDKTGYPLSPIFPDEKGSFNDRFAIPQAVTGLIANTRAIEVSVSNARQTLKEIQKAAAAETFQIERPGSTVLAGDIPEQPASGADQG